MTFIQPDLSEATAEELRALQRNVMQEIAKNNQARQLAKLNQEQKLELDAKIEAEKIKIAAEEALKEAEKESKSEESIKE